MTMHATLPQPCKDLYQKSPAAKQPKFNRSRNFQKAQ